MRSVSLATRVFAVIGASLLVAAVILGLLRSFSYLAVAACGLIFVAAALISHAIRSPTARGPSFLGLVGVVVSLVGTVTTVPFLYVGAGIIAAAGAIVLLFAVRLRSARS